MNPAEIALAGLLHDIGYFAQWAGHPLPPEASGPGWTAEFTDLAQEAISEAGSAHPLACVHSLPFLPEGLERSGARPEDSRVSWSVGPRRGACAQAHQLAGHFPDLSVMKVHELDRLPGQLRPSQTR